MGLNVLIINQSSDLCGLLSSFLVSEGHSATCIPGSIEAVKEAAQLRPDLIIIEVVMPELLAIEIVNRLHRFSAIKQTPVIVISDFPELEFELLHLYDFICRPVDLVRLREGIDNLVKGGKKRGALQSLPPLSPDDYLKFHDYLIDHCGLHFERRNIKMLERGLESRMAALKIGSFSDYFAYLTQNRERRQELQKLLQFLTVGETFFFRYHAHYAALMKTVLPEIIGKADGKSIRLWSAGCSTGEEPYSMAMAVMETVPDWRSRDIRILATDINNRSLMQAREGVYNTWKIRVTEKKYLEKYFRRIGESYVVRDEVKSLVEFAHLNLQTIHEPPHPLMSDGFDTIFCRNVMIYFTTATTRKVVEGFSGLLRQGGYLFLGHSETLSYISTRFERQIHDGGVYYRRKGQQSPLVETIMPLAPVATTPPAPPAKPSVTPPTPKAAAKTAPPLPRPEPEASLQELYDRGINSVEAENFTEAEQLFLMVQELSPEHTGAMLGLALISANCGRFRDALDGCNRALQLNDLLPEAYFLRGLIYEMLDQEQDSFQEYRTAILLRMEFIMPHYQLGKLYYRTGRQKDGARELKNSLKLLERVRGESIIPFSGGLSREVFLEQLRKEIQRVEAAIAA